MTHLRHLLTLSVLLIMFSLPAVAVPELDITPSTVNLTGNESVPANRNHTVELTVTNQDATRDIYNVTFPDKDYLYYSDNQFHLNASESRNVTATIYTPVPTKIRDQFTYNKSVDGERDPVKYYYNQTSGNQSEITFDAEHFPPMAFNIDTHWLNTSISTASLDSEFNLTFEETGDSVFKIENTGDATAYDIQLAGEDITFEQASGFNLSANDDTYVSFSVELPKPDENATEATNQTYTRAIQISGENFETSTITAEIFIPYRQYDTEAIEQNVTERWLEIQERTIELCQRDRFQDSPLCGGDVVRWRNNTEIVNRTPVYEMNLTPAEREALRTVNHTDERIQDLQERYDLLKHSLNTDIEQMNQTMVQRLETAVEYSKEAKETAQAAKNASDQRWQVEQQRSQSIAHQTTVVFVLFLVFAALSGVAVFLYKIYQRRNDYRLIQQ